MGRTTTNRKLAAALLKTLESDPAVDPQDPAFTHLKCTLLQRLLSLELETAETQASIHIVEPADSEPADSADTARTTHKSRTA